MAITFYTQSKKNPATIYVRYREGQSIDAKAKTNLKINPISLVKGRVKLVKAPSNIDAQKRKENQSINNDLNALQDKLNLLRSNITNKLNTREDYELIDSNWLKEVVNPKSQSNISNRLVGYFDYYLSFKKSSLQPSTIKKLKVFKSRIENYEIDEGIIHIQDVNKKFSLSMQKWCDDKNYAHNTKIKTLKVILTLCNHASENGIATSPELNSITKGLKYKNTEHVVLTLKELKDLLKTHIKDTRLDTARDWLVISCFTAQRVSDFLRFTKNDVVIQDGEYLLDIRQRKTDKPVYIPLSEEVISILNKRGGDFPPKFSKNENSNSAIYNRLIKDVCRLAKIDEIVIANIRNPKTNRYELKKVPKYKAITSHIGRRSFATNFYGHIDTSLLISATGHATEVQFLRYVGKTGTQNAILLAKEMRDFKTRLSQGQES